MAGLKSHDGRDVRGVKIKVTNTGDGLSQAMRVEPQELHFGDRVFVVMETTVVGDGHEPAGKDTDDLVLFYKLRAGTAAIVDEAVVKSALADMAERVQKMRDEESGAQHFDFDAEADPLDVGGRTTKEIKGAAKKRAPRKRP